MSFLFLCITGNLVLHELILSNTNIGTIYDSYDKSEQRKWVTEWMSAWALTSYLAFFSVISKEREDVMCTRDAERV